MDSKNISKAPSLWERLRVGELCSGMGRGRLLSVIILNWNGSQMMQKYLPSVIRYSQLKSGEPIDIVVADNGSTDDSLQMLSRDFPSVRQIILDQNYGFAEGYNRAIKAVEAEYVVLLNSDVEVPEGWLDPLVSYMDAHPDVAACQPKILSYTHKDTFEYAGAAGGYLDRFGYPFCKGRIFSTVEKDEGQYDTTEPQDILWATGACLLIRRDIYLSAGGLDTRFFAHNEEIDLCWRLCLYGYRIVCITDSHVYHLGGGTLPQGNPRKTYLNFRNNLTMLYKNLPDSELRSVLRWRTLLDYIAILQSLLKFNIPDVRAILRARRDFHAWQKDYLPIRQSIQHHAVRQLSNISLPLREGRGGSFSILYHYFLLRHTTFSQLPFHQ